MMNQYHSYSMHASPLQIKLNNSDFFPKNRALSLEEDEDTSREKLERLQEQLNYLVSTFKDMVSCSQHVAV